MGLPVWSGYLVFFGVPFVLWLIGAATVKERGFQARAFALLAGSDHRLSLSRLQAFLWTLVIFGSFAAAMAVHSRIHSGSKAEMEQAATVAKAAVEKKTEAISQVAKLAAEDKAAEEARDKAEADAEAADALLAVKSTQANIAADEKARAEKRAQELRTDFAAKVLVREKTAAKFAAAKAAAAKLTAEADAAVSRANSFNWVSISAELLALAGIAIGSGVFASLIGAVAPETNRASVTAIYSAGDATAMRSTANTGVAKTVMTIKGVNLTGASRVLLDSYNVVIVFGKPDGTEIAIEVPDATNYKVLIVDTPGDKLCFDISGSTPNLRLGEQRICYEFSDLFRDDKVPANYDLMKFQMFGWTMVAIPIYIILFLSDLSDHIDSLPNVPQSIVLLTGLSQAGYLAGKAMPSKTPNQ